MAELFLVGVSDFVTVFEIARGSNGVFAGEVFRLLISLTALIGGVAALVLKWRNNGAKTWFGAVFVIAWALLWLYLHNFPYVFEHINSLVMAYRDRQYQIVEGQVQVLHEHPATGHTKGDIPHLRGDGLLVGKSEAASSLIYWNGKRYVWFQQGD